MGSRAQLGAAPQPHSGPHGGVGPSTSSSFLSTLLAAGTSGGNRMGKAALGQRDALVSIINFPSSEDRAPKHTLRSGPTLSHPPAGLSLPSPHKAGGTLRSSHGQNGNTWLRVSQPLICPEWLGHERSDSGDVHRDGHSCAAHPELRSQEMGCGKWQMGNGVWAGRGDARRMSAK